MLGFKFRVRYPIPLPRYARPYLSQVFRQAIGRSKDFIPERILTWDQPLAPAMTIASTDSATGRRDLTHGMALRTEPAFPLGTRTRT